jgi:enoyl-CoA hydratase/carnithine racemase
VYRRGLELALSCDLILAAASARFAQAEASIGTATLLGGVQRLAERAGPARAREIIYSADQYDASTFERWNIVNRVVPDETFESEARSFVKRLASGATLAYSVGKRIVRAYLDAGTRTADRVVDDIAPPLFETEECAQGSTPCSNTGLGSFGAKSYSTVASTC